MKQRKRDEHVKFVIDMDGQKNKKMELSGIFIFHSSDIRHVGSDNIWSRT